MRALIVALCLLGSCKKQDDKQPDPGPSCIEPTVGELGPLQVGLARARMPAPLGIGTVGFNGLGVPSGDSPFSELFPATENIHNHPDFKAVAVSRGPGHELVFLRTDTVGIFQQFRRAVVLELNDRLGRDDMDDVLIIGATHTHSGPGRVVDAPDNSPFAIIADKFFPEFYARMVDTMASVVQAALSDLSPGSLGYVFADASVGMQDRRCEDGLDYVNGRSPVLAISRGGELEALVLSVPIHGTILSNERLHLSGDVSAGIEQAIEDGFDHPVQVQMMNAWAADVAPSNPTVPQQDGVILPDGYDQMERVGVAIAGAVHSALDGLSLSDDPMIWGRTHRVPIDREALEYDDETFQYPYGGVYCGQGPAWEPDCDASTDFRPTLDDVCLSFTEDFPAPMQTEFTAGQVGDLRFITFPGEGGTLLAEKVVAGIQAYGDIDDVWFLGYSQDYLGYSILEDDWWQGGYEAAGALWGPRQGSYLSDMAIEVFGRAICINDPVDEPGPPEAFGSTDYTPYSGSTAIDAGTIVTDTLDTYTAYTAFDTIDFVIAGDDPWFGAPIATLETASGRPVKRPNGMVLDSDHQAFWLHISYDPTYDDDPDAARRSFYWAFHLAAAHTTVGAVPELDGSYHLRVSVPLADGSSVELVSSDFTITP